MLEGASLKPKKVSWSWEDADRLEKIMEAMKITPEIDVDDADTIYRALHFYMHRSVDERDEWCKLTNQLNQLTGKLLHLSDVDACCKRIDDLHAKERLLGKLQQTLRDQAQAHEDRARDLTTMTSELSAQYRQLFRLVTGLDP